MPASSIDVGAHAPELPGYAHFVFASGAYAHPVYHAGNPLHPAVLVMCEIAGFSPGLLGFCERLQRAGFHVYVPWLFGAFRRRRPIRNALHLCISREFGRLRAGQSAPVTDWLRALAGHISDVNGGRRVGAIGMCLTGAFAIPLIIDPRVQAAVAAQPAVPCSLLFAALGIRASDAMGELNVSSNDLAAARARLAARDAHLLAVRARADRICPAEKLERLQAEFPIGLTVQEYGTPASTNCLGQRPHALFTKEYRLAPDAPPGHWASDAFADLVGFLQKNLR